MADQLVQANLAGHDEDIYFNVFDEVEIDDDTQSITWNARIKVLDGLVDEAQRRRPRVGERGRQPRLDGGLEAARVVARRDECWLQQ